MFVATHINRPTPCSLALSNTPERSSLVDHRIGGNEYPLAFNYSLFYPWKKWLMTFYPSTRFKRSPRKVILFYIKRI